MDRPIDRALELVPELNAQPVWLWAGTQYAKHDFDVSQMTVSSLCQLVIGPYLRRSLQNSDADPARRMLQYLEELLTDSDPVSPATASHTLEWVIFRAKLSDRAKPLMGPRSAEIIDSLTKAWAPWQPLTEILERFFLATAEVVMARYPQLKAGGSPSLYSGGRGYHYYYSFMYDPAGQRFEDLLLEFAVSNSDLAAADLPLNERDESVLYEIERGSGQPLAPQLGPIPLPPKGSSAYHEAIIDAAHLAEAHTWRHLPEVLPALATPYTVE